MDLHTVKELDWFSDVSSMLVNQIYGMGPLYMRGEIAHEECEQVEADQNEADQAKVDQKWRVPYDR